MKLHKLSLVIENLHENSYEDFDNALGELSGVDTAGVRQADKTLTVRYFPDTISAATIQQTVEKLGYKINSVEDITV